MQMCSIIKCLVQYKNIKLFHLASTQMLYKYRYQDKGNTWIIWSSMQLVKILSAKYEFDVSNTMPYSKEMYKCIT